MKNKMAFLILSLIFLLGGCMEVKTEKIELTYVDLNRNDNDTTAIYESSSKKKYYEIEISSYEYNHWPLKPGDTIQVIKEVEPISFLRIGEFNGKLNGKDIELIETTYFPKEE